MNDSAEQPTAALPPVEDRPNAVIDMTVESDEPNSFEAVCFEDEEVVQRHLAFSVLRGRRKPFSKADKTNLLLQLIALPPHRLFPKEMLDDGSLVSRVFRYLKYSSKSKRIQGRLWTVDIVASNLVRLKLLLEQGDNIQADYARPATRDQEVKNLRQKLDKMIATAEQEALTNAKKDASTKKRNPTLPNANRVQDHIPFVPVKVELEPCPACGNMTTMAIDFLLRNYRVEK